jgi:hypothetical protein
MTVKQEDASKVAETIRAFLEGTGGDWDWDDFTSCSLRDQQLDSIRKRAGGVELPVGPDERAALERLAEEAERLPLG